MKADAWDELHFPRPAGTDFDKVVDRAISRRGFFGGALAFGSAAALMGADGAMATPSATKASPSFAFEGIGIQTDMTVHVPAGYRWSPLIRWGDPLFSDAPAFDPAQGVTTEGSDRVFGENTDGMELFIHGDQQILAVNHEYTNNAVNLANADGVARNGAEVLKLQNFQGVTVMEIREGAEGWTVVKDSPFNRRITHLTPMRLDGPAAGHALVQTQADPEGRTVLGTLNNCGSGKTPWGTYLTCEENFNGYFGANQDRDYPDVVRNGYARYGIQTKAGPGYYNYHPFDARFDVATNPNEPHRHGYVVEINPLDPTSTPIKRTALGRIKHENAECVVARGGQVVVYMGDDERGEFLYRWVSRDRYVPGGETASLLTLGTLFVAQFNDDMTGRWLPLTPETTGFSAAEIAIFTRTAASKVGATTMDRPEWVAVHPSKAEVYCTLTNNTRRGQDSAGAVRTNAGGDPMPVNGPNPRDTNRYGQVVRWRPEDADHASDTFRWDLYIMAGNPLVHKDGPYAGSANINAGNLFNSPDGLALDSTGMVWIQTDGEDNNTGDFAGMGNNQMLAGDPETGELRRFLTGPRGCEITGLTWSADKRTMFVGIQHPDAGFPEATGLPRSTLIAIKRKDNGRIG